MKQTCMYCERKLHHIEDVPRAQATSNFCRGDSTYACRTAVYTRIHPRPTSVGRARRIRGSRWRWRRRRIIIIIYLPNTPSPCKKLVVQQLSLNVAQFNARACLAARGAPSRCTDSACTAIRV
uniref:Uncharacterized protein n=1 Tax=Trichogramma kaykai TaxID=54128 RepID=A0ABD2XD66_9HYME